MKGKCPSKNDPNMQCVPDYSFKNVTFDWYGIDEEEEVYLRFNPNLPGHDPN